MPANDTLPTVPAPLPVNSQVLPEFGPMRVLLPPPPSMVALTVMTSCSWTVSSPLPPATCICCTFWKVVGAPPSSVATIVAPEPVSAV